MARIQDKRAKPIDLFMLSSMMDGTRTLACEQSPLEILDLLTDSQMIELKQDILKHLEDNEDDKPSIYWKSLLNVLEYYIKGVGGEDQREEVERIVLERATTLENLESLRESILSKQTADPEYWALALRIVDFRLACLQLADWDNRDKHEGVTLVNAPLVLLSSTTFTESSNWKSERKKKLERLGFDNSNQALEFKLKMMSRHLPHPSKLLKEPCRTKAQNSQQTLIPQFHAIEHCIIPWTKYNRAFYDRKCPPPVLTVGYTFTFYLGAISMSYSQQTEEERTPLSSSSSWVPTYECLDEDSAAYTTTSSAPSPNLTQRNREKCLLWFRFKEPYVDVAFRIVRDRWATRKSDGFICQYDPINSKRFTLKFSFLRNIHKR